MEIEDHKQLISSILNMVKQTTSEYKQRSEDFYLNYSAKASTISEMTVDKKAYKEKINRIIVDIQNQMDEVNEETRQLTELLKLEETNCINAEAIKNKREKALKELEQDKKSFVDGENARKLLKAKALVQSCKMLTSTTFQYGGPEVSGFIRKNGTNEMKGFILEAKSPEKTTEFLWNKLENIFLSKC